MKAVFDKSIHRDEFRLRILMTDGCNKNCSFCLNDFQPKPRGKPEFIDAAFAAQLISVYCHKMELIGKQPIVTFSGGEPGIHPKIHTIVRYAKRRGAVVKVVTNGTALYLTPLKEFVDCWHVSVTKKDENLIEFLETNPGYNVQIQHVLIRGHEFLGRKYFPLREPYELIKFYGPKRLPIKLWVDFFDSKEDKKSTEGAIIGLVSLFPDYEIKSRFAGRQENRGIACRGCERDCVTLKALWAFPDNTVSVCPQGVHPRIGDGPYGWMMGAMKKALEVHEYKEDL